MASALPTFTDIQPQVNTIYNLGTISGLQAFADLTSLAAYTPTSTDVIAGVADLGDGTSAWYRWDSTSVAADDGLLTVAPINGMTGRWIRGL